MKYVIITQYFHPENFRINDVAEHLHAKGHDVTVLTGQPDYPNKKQFKDYQQHSLWSDNFSGIRVLRVPTISRGSGSSIRLILNYLSFIISSIVFGLPRIKGRPDACLIWASSPITVCIPAILLKWIKKTPCAVWVQDLWPESIKAVGAVESNSIYNAVGQLVKFIYKNMDLILIQSTGFIPSVKKWGARTEQIKYLPNWAESLDLNKTYPLPEEFQDDANKKILFAGNLGKAQSISTILEAAKILQKQQITWYLLGDGSELENILAKIKSTGLGRNVIHIPRKSSDEVPPYLLHSDILCVTLKKDPIFSLTIPSKVQTYLSSGKPIVAAIDGTSSELINGSNSGLAGPAQDSETLANNVNLLLNSSTQQLKEMGSRGKSLIEHRFNKAKVLDEIEVLLKRMECK